MNLLIELTQDDIRKIIAAGYDTDIENVTVKYNKQYEGYYKEEEVIELSVQVRFPNYTDDFYTKPQKDRCQDRIRK